MRTDRILYAGLGIAAIFVLPGCAFQTGGLANLSPNFDPGPTPRNNVVFCDIEAMGPGVDGTARVCAPDDITASKILPLTNAAIALNTGQMSGMTALDKSTDALNRCPHGEIVTFIGAYPQGDATCLNCGHQIPDTFPDAKAVCQAVCEDKVVSSIQNPPDPSVVTFCQNHAKVSTNVPTGGCPIGFANACSDAGTVLPDFEPFNDPRIQQEPVTWAQLTGVSTGGANNNDLIMTGPTVPNTFTAQAVSTQVISSGDAYVEFTAGETTLAHVIGFTQLPPGCLAPNPCNVADGDPTPNDINFALRLGTQGLVFVSNAGVLVPGPGASGELGTYLTNDRFRITLTDQGNGTFSVKYDKVLGTCTPGKQCSFQPVYTDTLTGQYPVRVDTSFRDNGAHLVNVTVVRIQPE